MTGNDKISNICENLGIKRKDKIHSLECSFIAHFLKSEVDLKHIQEFLSHCIGKKRNKP